MGTDKPSIRILVEKGADKVVPGGRAARSPSGKFFAYTTSEGELRIIDFYGRLIRTVPDIEPQGRLYWISWKGCKMKGECIGRSARKYGLRAVKLPGMLTLVEVN